MAAGGSPASLSNGALATAAGEDGHADGMAGAAGAAPAEEAALRALPRPRHGPMRRLPGHLLLVSGRQAGLRPVKRPGEGGLQQPLQRTVGQLSIFGPVRSSLRL